MLFRSPLLQKWEQSRQEIRRLVALSKAKNDKNHKLAKAEFVRWLSDLQAYRILDPACGSGNFLFLGLKVLKDIEHASHLEAAKLGLDREADLVTGPHNMLGLELNEYAAELARVTVWIGELQWRLTHGYEFKTNPVLEPLDCIECRDALITFRSTASSVHPTTSPVHPTASPVRPEPVEGSPETPTVRAEPVEATWPKASVVVGNPPFLGGKKFVSELGESYANSLRKIFAGRVPGLADLVAYWFEKARAQMMSSKLSAAGFVTTNSLRDGFGHEVLKRVNTDTPIFQAWSDEPWVNEGAAVRVSLIAFSPHVIDRHLNGQEVKTITSDLSSSESGSAVDLTLAKAITGNAGVAFQGTTRSGPFDIPGQLAREWLQLPNPHGRPNTDVVRPWSNGLDVTRRPSDTWIIDFGTNMAESDASLYEKPFEHCVRAVKPTRISNRNPKLVSQFWHYDGVRVGMRKAITPLHRYLATTITAKFRTFVWFHPSKLADATLVAIARSDDTTFGILHSRFHELWSLATGSTLEDRPRYLPGAAFETFPFPAGLTPQDTASQQTRRLASGAVVPDVKASTGSARTGGDAAQTVEAIAEAAHKLTTLRDNWLNPPDWTQRLPEVVPLGMATSPYPDRIVPKLGFEKELSERTLTKLYNARPTWLASAHAALDISVATAYGWTEYTPEMPDEVILQRLLALNVERSVEKSGMSAKV